MGALLLALLAAAPSLALAQVSAVQKVIMMLGDMAAKGKKEKHNEEILFAAFQQSCVDNTAKLEESVAKHTEKVEMFGASANKLTSDASLLSDEISKLQAELAASEAAIKKEQSQREMEHKAFVLDQTDYEESLSALDRAILVLKQQNYDRTGDAKGALLQVAERQGLPEKARAMVQQFAELMYGGDDDQDFMDYEAPEAKAYESQTGGVIEVLEHLRTEFAAKKEERAKEEMNAKHASDMMLQDLADTVDNAKEDIAAKTQLRAGKLEQAAVDGKSRDLQKANEEADGASLSDLKVECEEKAQSFSEKQKLRVEEIDALEKAIEILSSQAGPELLAASKHLSRTQAASALLQMRRDGGIGRKVRDFLASESRRLGSKRLGLLADRLASDPFAKVKRLIQDMITRLLGEANQDAEHEGFCNKEIGQSKLTRGKLSEEVDLLAAAVEQGKAQIEVLGQDVARLQQEVAALDAAMAQATTLRTEEKEKNSATIADAKEAQVAVQSAMDLLQKFYEKAGVATALVQEGAVRRPKMGSEEWKSLANPDYDGPAVDKGHRAGMQTFGETYSGQQDEAGGVLAMLEVILSDFASLEADTASSELQASQSYNKFMADSKRDRAVKQRGIEMSDGDKAAAISKLQSDTEDLKSTQDQLLAADRYYEKLVPQCLNGGQTYEQRKKSREEEIQSLREALEILESQ